MFLRQDYWRLKMHWKKNNEYNFQKWMTKKCTIRWTCQVIFFWALTKSLFDPGETEIQRIKKLYADIATDPDLQPLIVAQDWILAHK